MSEYHRLYRQQGWYFFTVVTYCREKILIQLDNLIRRRQSFRYLMKKLPFKMDAVVILPDHIHCIWRLPSDDGDFSTRWKLIKRYFSIGMNAPLTSRSEKKVWQRRFWEHMIRGQTDFNRHCDYIHYNPVRHGLVHLPLEWKHSSFREFVEKGLYSQDWGQSPVEGLHGMNLE